MKVIAYRDEIYKLYDIALSWREGCECDTFGLEVDNTKHLKDLRDFKVNDDSELFVLLDNDSTPVGYIAISITDSPIGNQKVASEKYWFVLPKHRGLTSIKLLKVAKEWAKNKGCSHIILHATNIASKLHDDVCRLYELLGMSKLGTSYINKL